MRAELERLVNSQERKHCTACHDRARNEVLTELSALLAAHPQTSPGTAHELAGKALALALDQATPWEELSAAVRARYLHGVRAVLGAAHQQTEERPATDCGCCNRCWCEGVYHERAKHDAQTEEQAARERPDGTCGCCNRCWVEGTEFEQAKRGTEQGTKRSVPGYVEFPDPVTGEPRWRRDAKGPWICAVTGNACGSDTWEPHRPCLCSPCQRYLAGDNGVYRLEHENSIKPDGVVFRVVHSSAYTARRLQGTTARPQYVATVYDRAIAVRILEALNERKAPEQAARERPDPEVRREASQLFKCDTYAPLASAYLEGYRAAERRGT